MLSVVNDMIARAAAFGEEARRIEQELDDRAFNNDADEEAAICRRRTLLWQQFELLESARRAVRDGRGTLRLLEPLRAAEARGPQFAGDPSFASHHRAHGCEPGGKEVFPHVQTRR
jgi:hypothetical protein